jgi:hypothetical protein
MGWPQITIIALAAAGVAINAAKHGESKGKYNFWAAIVGVGVEMPILWAGGFFG